MTVAELPQVITPNGSFRKQVEEFSGQKVSACFQCEKCTNGCPLAFAMDIPPHKLIRAVHFGLKDQVLDSETVCVCAACETCTTRCPNGIDIAHLMDTLRQIARRECIDAAKKDVSIFHMAFISSMRRHGRVYPAEVGLEFTLRSAGMRGLMKQAKMGLVMLKRGKLKLMPAHFRANSHIRSIFKNTR